MGEREREKTRECVCMYGCEGGGEGSGRETDGLIIEIG